MQIIVMEKFIASAFIIIIFSCNGKGEEQDAASPGTLPTYEMHDTSRLITDSVLIKDTNTSDVEVMKKIN